MTPVATLPAPVQSAMFIALVALTILFPLMPMQLEAEAPALPDILFALIAAWILRRPNNAPMLLVAASFLAADFILGRPVGLWALICLLSSEFFRGQHASLRDQLFVFEFLTFAIVLGVALLAQTLILTITLVPQPGASSMLEVYLMTLASYPFVVALLHYVFRIRAPKLAERSQRLGRVS